MIEKCYLSPLTALFGKKLPTRLTSEVASNTATQGKLLPEFSTDFFRIVMFQNATQFLSPSLLPTKHKGRTNQI